MCGIAGYEGSGPLQPERIAEALRKMGHRGPDHAAHLSFQTRKGRHVELLHTRLSVIDLDPRSNQPLRVGSKSMVYNGELYNYLELRARLEADGVAFRTQSDTEVLLSTIVHGGLEALDLCEGMWAFAVHDETTGELLLSRDRFGEKPLYVYRDGNALYFGSEVKAIVALLGRPLDHNERHLRRYLVNGYKSLYKTRETFFEGLEELPPGTTLRLSGDGEVRQERYWDPQFGQEQSLSFDEAVTGARERLTRSVELRLRSDVPLAFCVSGGIDSLSLVGIAKRVFDHDVHGFTIINSDPRYEEQDMIDHAVAEFGIDHMGVETDTADFLPRLRNLVRHHDAPVYTISHFAQWFLMDSISERGFRVSVSGTGADELFSGYYDHHLAYLYDLRNDHELALASRLAWEKEVLPFVRNPFLQDPDYFVDDPARRDHIYLNADEFASFLHGSFDEPFTETPFPGDLLRRRMMNELFAESVPVILHEEDINAMYFSIENRSPFLDRDLLEFASRIPTRHLVRNGRAKAVLRHATRGLVPERCLFNPRKVGFNAPLSSFLDLNDRDVRGWLLGDGPIWKLVRREPIAELIEAESLPNSKSKFLFNFTCAKLFLEEFAA